LQSRSSDDLTGAIRTQITRGELFPGEQLRQDALATKYEVSRTPIRLALEALKNEGLLTHLPDRGYFVTRRTNGELDEIFALRRLLEHEICRQINRDDIDISRLRKLQEQMEVDFTTRSSALDDLNYRFHTTICKSVDLPVHNLFLDRVKSLSGAYRTMRLRSEAELEKAFSEHRQMIAALESGHIDEFLGIADAHRQAAREVLMRSGLVGIADDANKESRDEAHGLAHSARSVLKV
jgi:DNA-binding GntR family transcriptional regulator